MQQKLPKIFRDNFELREPTPEELSYINEQCSFYFLSRNHSVYGRLFVLSLMCLAILFLILGVITYIFYNKIIGTFLLILYALTTIGFAIGTLVTTQKSRERENFKSGKFLVAETMISDRVKWVRDCRDDDSLVLANIQVFAKKHILELRDVLMTEKLKTILEFQNINEYPCLLIFVKDKHEIFAITQK